MAFITVTNSDTPTLLNPDHFISVDVVQREDRFRIRIRTVEGKYVFADPTNQQGEVITQELAKKQGVKVLLDAFLGYLVSASRSY